MKTLISYLFPLLVLLSCKKESDPVNTSPESTLKTDSTTLRLSGTINRVDFFAIQASGKWTLSITPSAAA